VLIGGALTIAFWNIESIYRSAPALLVAGSPITVYFDQFFGDQSDQRLKQL
jgi:hypothetical protein